MQVLEWAATYPESVFAAVPIATAAYHSAQNIAFNEVGRQAIFADPDWQGGRYWERGRIPARGLAVARMVRAHHLSVRTGADPQIRPPPARRRRRISLFGDMFEVESYLRHQGSTFVHRFDANSYLTITRAMDYFDLAAEHDGDLAAAFAGTRTRFCIISFSSDWLFPTAESRAIARALNRAAANVSFVEIASRQGPRRLPAGRAGFPSHPRRLPGRLRRARRPAAFGRGAMNVAGAPIRYVAKNMRLDLRLIADMIAPGSARAGYRLRRRHADRAICTAPAAATRAASKSTWRKSPAPWRTACR